MIYLNLSSFKGLCQDKWPLFFICITILKHLHSRLPQLENKITQIYYQELYALKFLNDYPLFSSFFLKILVAAITLQKPLDF